MREIAHPMLELTWRRYANPSVIVFHANSEVAVRVSKYTGMSGRLFRLLQAIGMVGALGWPTHVFAQTEADDSGPVEPVEMDSVEMDSVEMDSVGDGQSLGLPDWLEGFEFSAFVDAYAQGIWTLPEPFSGDQGDLLGYRSYTHVGGLTVSFLGFDVGYKGDHFGATLNLRFGTSTPRLLGPTSGLPDGMQFLKQAYVSWTPLDALSIDFGQFDTVYGAEVSESWMNQNYSRGALYIRQPFYHAGFRVAYRVTDEFTLTGLAVNGWNSVIDNNDGKSFGLQARYSLGDFNMSAGYLGGPEGDDDSLWRHFGDVVITAAMDDFSMVANANYVAEDLGDGSFDQFWGVMLGGRLAFPPNFAMALRGEYIGDPDDDSGLFTATFTLELVPVEHLVIRLENRVDVATDDRFQDSSGAPSETVVSTILGVVVHS